MISFHRVFSAELQHVYVQYEVSLANLKTPLLQLLHHGDPMSEYFYYRKGGFDAANLVRDRFHRSPQNRDPSN